MDRVETIAVEPAPTFRDLLRDRNFVFLWLGEAFSLLGDQFYMIALPWLVFQLTRDPLAVGTVLAAAGIPRALFMLVGGALTDRFNPRTVMMISNLVRLVLVTLLAGLVFSEQIQLWSLYVFALAFGLADAFFFPAQTAIIPRMVQPNQLQSANALMNGMSQVSLFAGPLLAGLLIALFDQNSQQIDGQTLLDMKGIALAFAFDAFTFLISVGTLLLVTVPPLSNSDTSDAPSESVIQSIMAGVTVVWNDIPVRTFFFLIAVSNLLLNGPIFVGIPILAEERLPESAAAYGFMMSAYGGGMLFGTALAGFLPRPAARYTGMILSVIWSLIGLGIAILGVTYHTPMAVLVMLIIGMADGYVVILFMTWLQSRTPPAMLGRVMSLLMFSILGLQPISQALTGGLVKWNLTAVFVGGGIVMMVMVALSALNPAIRSMELPETASAPPAA